MSGYIIRRVLYTVTVLIAISIFGFVIIELPRLRPWTISAASRPKIPPDAPIVGAPLISFER